MTPINVEDLFHEQFRRHQPWEKWKGTLSRTMYIVIPFTLLRVLLLHSYNIKAVVFILSLLTFLPFIAIHLLPLTSTLFNDY